MPLDWAHLKQPYRMLYQTEYRLTASNWKNAFLLTMSMDRLETNIYAYKPRRSRELYAYYASKGWTIGILCSELNVIAHKHGY